MNSDAYRQEMKIEWVLMNMRLSGSAMNQEKAARIASGEYVLEATLEEHLLVTGLLELLLSMEALLGMGEELSAATLNRFYQALNKGKIPPYRKRTPILFHLSYNPVLPQEIEPELWELFRRLHDDVSEDPVSRAIRVHNEIIRIYPYDDCNEIMARAAMEYELCYSGLSMYPLTVSESVYNEALAVYLKMGKEDILGKNLQMNRLMMENRR